MMLGQMRLTGADVSATTSRRWNRTAAILADALAQAVEQLAAGHLSRRSRTRSPSRRSKQTIPAPGFRQTRTPICLHDGMVCIREENVLRPLTDLPAETRSRIRGI
ncbi:MAG: hypothetical protein V9H26_19730 [Verrucomicrobiota bacterium]